MRVRFEIGIALMIVVLSSALVTARPGTARSHQSDGRVARAAKAPVDAFRDWAAELAEACLKAAQCG
jgi:hypothetical protein